MLNQKLKRFSHNGATGGACHLGRAQSRIGWRPCRPRGYTSRQRADIHHTRGTAYQQRTCPPVDWWPVPLPQASFSDVRPLSPSISARIQELHLGWATLRDRTRARALWRRSLRRKLGSCRSSRRREHHRGGAACWEVAWGTVSVSWGRNSWENTIPRVSSRCS